MPGQLDQISEAIGALRSDVKGLGRQVGNNTREIRENRKAGDRRHDENSRAIADLDVKVDNLTKRVGKVEPIAEGYKVTKIKVAGALTLAAALFVGIGWIAQKLLAAAFGWLWPIIASRLGL